MRRIASAPLAALALALVLPLPGLAGEVVVKPGETLSEIAERYGVSVQRLMQLNGLREPKDLWAGSRIVVPGASGGSGSASGSGAGSGNYTVKSGETLSEIAERYGVSVQRLMQLNGLRDAKDLWAGSRIVVPGASSSSSRSATPSRTAKQHTVQSGETLSEIADRYGLSVERLVALNGLSKPDELMVGTTLKLRASQPARKPAKPPVLAKAVVKPATKTAAKPVAKPTAQPVVQPVIQASAAPAPKAAAAPKPAPTPAPAKPAVVATATALQPTAQPTPKAEPKPEPKPVAKLEPKPDPKPEPKPEIKPEIKVAVKPEIQPQPEPKPAAKPAPKPALVTAKATAQPGKPAAPDWRTYGPLQVDWANWQPMGGSYVAPSLNSDGQPLYLAINCSARRLNATGQSGTWKTWDMPQSEFEQQLITDLCKAKQS